MGSILKMTTFAIPQQIEYKPLENKKIKKHKRQISVKLNLSSEHVKKYILSQSDFTLFTGGVGTGKTIGNIQMILYYAERFPGIDILYVCPTYVMLYDTVIREFRNLCPEEIVKKTNYGIYPEAVFVWKNKNDKRSTVRFRAFADAGRPRSITVGMIIVDELTVMQKLVFDELFLRIRQENMPNQMKATTNADDETHWVYEDYLSEEISKLLKKKDFWHLTASSFTNKFLPKNYLKRLRLYKSTRPGHYRQKVLGVWGGFADEAIGAILKTDTFQSDFTVGFVDISFSNKDGTDRTAVAVVGFHFIDDQNFIIEFDGMTFQKSFVDPLVKTAIVQFLRHYQPIESTVESQLSDAGDVVILDPFLKEDEAQATEEKSDWLNYWTTTRQPSNRSKHSRISSTVIVNRDKLRAVQTIDKTFYNKMCSYRKGIDHDDEADAVAGAIHLYLTSKMLKVFVKAHSLLKGLA